MKHFAPVALCLVFTAGLTACDNSPPTIDPLYQEAVVALQEGRTETAVATFYLCVARDPSAAKCHRALGIAHARMSQPETAVRHYETYVALAPEAEDAAQVRELLAAYASGH